MQCETKTERLQTRNGIGRLKAHESNIITGYVRSVSVNCILLLLCLFYKKRSLAAGHVYSLKNLFNLYMSRLIYIWEKGSFP